MQRWSTFERLYGRMEGGREGQEGAGAEECLFEWSLSWIQVLTLQPFHSLEG